MLINCMESFDAIDLEENFHLSTTTGFDVLSVSVCMFPRFANKWVLRFTRYRRAERWDSIRETFQQRSFHSTARCIGCMLTFLCCALFRDVLLNFWEDRLLRSKVKGGEWQEPNNVFFFSHLASLKVYGSPARGFDVMIHHCTCVRIPYVSSKEAFHVDYIPNMASVIHSLLCLSDSNATSVRLAFRLWY